MLFSNMTMNPQPLRIDFDYSSHAEFGTWLVNSLFAPGQMIGISVYNTTHGMRSSLSRASTK